MSEQHDPATWDDDHLRFAAEHQLGILATTRRDGSPQQSMIGYHIDETGRILVSAKTYTAKWNNALRQPLVSLTIPDGREHLVVYGEAEGIVDEPLRSELTALVMETLSGNPAPDPSTLVAALDEQQRTILRITPTKSLFHA